MTITIKRINHIVRKGLSLLLISSFLHSLSMSAWGLLPSVQVNINVITEKEAYKHPTYQHLPSELAPHAYKLKTFIDNMPTTASGIGQDDFFRDYVEGVLKGDGLGYIPQEKTTGTQLIQRAKAAGFDPEDQSQFGLPISYSPTDFSQVFLPFIQEDCLLHSNPIAQFFLGIAHQYGLDITQSPKMALGLFLASAKTRLYKRSAAHLELYTGNFLPYIDSLQVTRDELKRIANTSEFDNPENSVKRHLDERMLFAYTLTELQKLETALKKLPGDYSSHFAFYESLASSIESMLRKKYNDKPLTTFSGWVSVLQTCAGAAGLVSMILRPTFESVSQSVIGTVSALATGQFIGGVLALGDRFEFIVKHPIEAGKILIGRESELPLAWTSDRLHQEAQYVALYLTLKNHKDLKADYLLTTLKTEVEAKIHQFAADVKRPLSFAQYFIQ
jgi:hypothetical protein